MKLKTLAMASALVLAAGLLPAHAEEQADPHAGHDMSASADTPDEGGSADTSDAQGGGMKKGKKGMGGGKHGGGGHKGGMHEKHEQVVKRLDMIELRLANLERMLERLMMR